MFKGERTREAHKRRHKRVRVKIQGTPEIPRLSVFRSLTHIYAQIIDDIKSHTLVAASTLDSEIKTRMDAKSKGEQAQLVGSLIARRAIERGISKVVFDRGGYKYHGRVKALAEAAREGGLKF